MEATRASSSVPRMSCMSYMSYAFFPRLELYLVGDSSSAHVSPLELYAIANLHRFPPLEL